MDTYRKTKISDLESLKNLKDNDIVIFSRDEGDDTTYDKTHTIKASDLFKSFRLNIGYWSTYNYNYEDKSLEIWSDDNGVFTVTSEGAQISVQTNSPTTSFEVPEGGTTLNILP
jgi:hypothetical protein